MFIYVYICLFALNIASQLSSPTFNSAVSGLPRRKQPKAGRGDSGGRLQGAPLEAAGTWRAQV